jgi:hypothetical protein
LEQGLDGAALVRAGVRFRGLLEGKGEVEDDAGVDPARKRAFEQVGQVCAYRGGTAAESDASPEQVLLRTDSVLRRASGQSNGLIDGRRLSTRLDELSNISGPAVRALRAAAYQRFRELPGVRRVELGGLRDVRP